MVGENFFTFPDTLHAFRHMGFYKNIFIEQVQLLQRVRLPYYSTLQ